MNLHIINGPNLNLLGKREPHIYGHKTWEMYFQELITVQSRQWPDAKLHQFMSNHEGELIDYIHSIGFEQNTGIIINPGAYTHTSIAISDAIAAVPAPCIEVHISNVHARESFRRHSYITPMCKGAILGLGLDGYSLALDAMYRLLKQ